MRAKVSSRMLELTIFDRVVRRCLRLPANRDSLGHHPGEILHQRQGITPSFRHSLGAPARM